MFNKHMLFKDIKNNNNFQKEKEKVWKERE